MPKTARDLSITACSFPFPLWERWERPRQAFSRLAKDHPGRLAHGPEEKFGTDGRTIGFKILLLPSRGSNSDQRSLKDHAL